MIYIVGLGPGSADYMTAKAIRTVEKCDAVIGFKRALDTLDFIDDDKKIYMKSLKNADKFIIKNERETSGVFYENTAIIASGDPTFYGISNYIKNRADLEFEIIPGLSSFQYLMSKVKMPWNNAHLGSLHGRIEDFMDTVRKHELTIWLTDKENNPAALCQKLVSENISASVIIGQNLSYDDEKILTGKPEEFINCEFSGLNVFVVCTM